MFGKQNGRHHRHGRRSAVPGTRGLRARLSYANVTASLALFVALGGTAAAAVTLPRDSVGSPQIRTDAVRSPEIAKDAVRSPEIKAEAIRSSEIKAEAIRSSEIRDNGVRLTDIADGARGALQTSVRFAEAAHRSLLVVPVCSNLIDLRVCRNLVSLAALPAGNWLVQAKFTLAGNPAGFSSTDPSCGLVQGPPVSNDATVLDEDDALLVARAADGQAGSENVTLVDVVTTAARTRTRIGLRCNALTQSELQVRNVKLTALEVANVVGP
jgi:hypothetical protein